MTFRRPIPLPTPSSSSSSSSCHTAAPLSLPWPGVNAICTSTLTITLYPLPTSPFWPECAHRPTSTLYNATSTLVASLDCAGCNAIHVSAVPDVRCPENPARPGTTVLVDQTTTTTLTVCSLTARTTA
ncbi:hypothetical protein ESCO_003639 [Escovopsis weberi]|uniref:Uncharacterized protein n=1 Tax=Escovopsis weberi TaxID=150374 RepID=A0A0M9VX97_ESCWE|nr:hypothetical protein ESCO_003639 [Escovopsis weberi]